MHINAVKLLTLLIFLYPTSGSAMSFGFNPYAGVGDVSDGSTVKSATGIRGSLEKVWKASSKWQFGPRLEVGNTYVNTKDEQNNRRVLSTYDNRFFVGGIHSGYLFETGGKFPHEAYTTFCTGKGIAKLSQDESGEDYFAQKQYKNINGYYYTAEVGTNLQVKRDIAFNFALIGNYFDADLGRANGTMSGEYANKEGVFALEEGEENKLPDRVIQKIITASFGLNMNF